MPNMKLQPNSPTPTKTPGVWNPALVGTPAYPSTLEIYEARRRLLAANVAKARAAGKMTRLGSPNGFRGRRDEADRLQREAHAAACKMVDRWNSANLTAAQYAVYVPSNMPGSDIGDEALAAVLAVAICPAYAATERLMAAKIALPHLRPRPTNRSVVTLEGALSFLDSLIDEGRGNDVGMAAPRARF
jgi:hypothetical protein